MKLHEELYFDITAEGNPANLKKFVAFLLSGDLDEYIEITEDHISYSDNYSYASETDTASITLSNDDYGIEIDSFDTEEFLDVLCSAAKNLFIHGNIFDIDDEEYRFTSDMGSDDYYNSDSVKFHDELDDERVREESEEDDEDF